MKPNKVNVVIILSTVLLMLILSLSTRFIGITDIGDYTNTAKFLAGESVSKIRSSHSLLYSMMFAPFVKLTNDYLVIKLATILWLFLLILSVYYLSNKNRKTLLLLATAPAVWYMVPWISPVPLAALLFLWTYHFIKKYDAENKLKYLLYSGLLMGLACAVWDPALYFAGFLSLCFFYDKKLLHFFYYLASIFAGMIPKFVLDYFLFNFPFYGLLRFFSGEITFTFFGSIYENISVLPTSNIILAFLFIPVFSYILFSKKLFQKHKKTMFFIIFFLILLIFNAQQRITLMYVPIILLILGETLTEKQFKIQLAVFLIISLLIINPYIIQIKYETNGREFNSFISALPNIKLSPQFSEDLIKQDLEEISSAYSNESFVVGNRDDHYAELDRVYWGSEITEFVSIQDYRLFLENKSIIFEKIFSLKPNIQERREIWIQGGIKKNSLDSTDYNTIEYGISFDETLDLEDFVFVKKYGVLSLFKKD